MDPLTLIVLVLFIALVVFWFVWASMVGKAAEQKLRNRKSFFLLSVATGPLFMAVVVAAIPFPDNHPLNPKNRLDEQQFALK